MGNYNQRRKFSRGEIVLSVLAVVVMGVLASLLVYSRKNGTQMSYRYAVMGNLRIIGSSAQQYMGEKGRTMASYWDLVGMGTENYVRSVNSVQGEDYSHLVIFQTDTQISVSSVALGTVTFNL